MRAASTTLGSPNTAEREANESETLKRAAQNKWMAPCTYSEATAATVRWAPYEAAFKGKGICGKAKQEHKNCGCDYKAGLTPSMVAMLGGIVFRGALKFISYHFNAL